MAETNVHHLSKSRFVAGLQCHKQLWWRVHEPNAPELVPDGSLQAVFDRGNRVGELARTHVPGGVLIDVPVHQFSERVAATKQALAGGARAVYEASFIADGVFASVDILEKRRNGFGIMEVKSTLDVKEAHLPDIAIQLQVVRRSGMEVSRAELMHLNRECSYPDLSNLFVRENVTRQATALARTFPKKIEAQHKMLLGELPDIKPGDHCTEPYECPFLGRCWPQLPEHHVSTLYRLSSKKVAVLVERGWTTIYDLPEDFKAKGPALRQIQSVREDRLVVEPGLAKALRPLKAPIAFLDFETINPAIPAWPGCHPYEQVPVQFSCHVLRDGQLTHHEWLAEGPEDPREDFSRALLDACTGVKTILAYNAPFERTCIEHLAEAVPSLAGKLNALATKIEDLLPLVRDHIYHPNFGGGFSIKKVLPALVPDLGYDDLAIGDGTTASTALEALLLDAEALTLTQQKTLRRDLLAYCERDTLAMVKLHERLEELAG